MLKRRRWNKFYANLKGFFWKPCPRCGQMFGGQEIAKGEPGKILVEGEDDDKIAGEVEEVDQHGNVLHRWVTCPECPGKTQRVVEVY